MNQRKQKREFTIFENYLYSFMILGIFFSMLIFLFWGFEIGKFWFTIRLWIVLSILLGTIAEVGGRKK